jgi:hypothetical protein
MATKTVTLAELQAHNSKENCYVAINGKGPCAARRCQPRVLIGRQCTTRASS